MAEAQKSPGNRGYLYPNNKKQAGDSQPDFRGKLNYKGQEILVSGWWSERDGEKFLSLQSTDPSERPAPRSGQAQGQGGYQGQGQRASGPAPRPASPAPQSAAPPAPPRPPADGGIDDLGLGDIFSNN